MTRVQRAQLRQSELRTALNAELDKTAEEREDGKLEELSAQMKGVEVELRAALMAAEQSDLPADTETTRDGENADPEQRELRELLNGARMSDYFSEQLGTVVTGASRELREHSLGSNMLGYAPIDLLLDDSDADPDREMRADAVSDIATAIQDNQQSIAGRLFRRSDTSYMGAMMPTVPVGTVTYPRITSTAKAHAINVGARKDTGKASLTSVSINPQRLTAGYVFGVETLSKISGWEEALRQDLRETMDDQLDNLVIAGQTAAGDDSAFAGLLNSTGTPTAYGSGAVDWTDHYALYDQLVDGLIAYSPDDVRLLVGLDYWKAVMKLERGTSANAGLMRDHLMPSNFRVSGRIPAAASKKQKVLAAISTSDRVRGLYCPTWRGMEIITDPYTGADKGQRKITAILIVGCAMVDARMFRQYDVTFQA